MVNVEPRNRYVSSIVNSNFKFPFLYMIMAITKEPNPPKLPKIDITLSKIFNIATMFCFATANVAFTRFLLGCRAGFFVNTNLTAV